MEGTAPSPLRPKRNVILFYYIPSDPQVCASSGVPELGIGGVVKVGWESNPNSNYVIRVS
jgi:hypothetical protein